MIHPKPLCSHKQQLDISHLAPLRTIIALQEELEEARSALAMEVSAYKIRIKQLSDDLLFRLSGSKVPQAVVHCLPSWSRQCAYHDEPIVIRG